MRNLKLYEEMEPKKMLDDLVSLGFMHEYEVSIELTIYRQNKASRFGHADDYLIVPFQVEIIVSSDNEEDILKAAFEKYKKGEYEEFIPISFRREDAEIVKVLDRYKTQPGPYLTLDDVKSAMEEDTTIDAEFPTEGDIIIKEIK